MVNTISTARDVVSALGGIKKTAELLHVGYSAVSNMQQRNAFPPRYWPKLASSATDRGISGVTLGFLETLVEAVEKRPRHLRNGRPQDKQRRAANV